MSNNNFTQVNREFSWDDEIRNDGAEWTLLPEGEYPFTVTKFERSRYEGGAKLPPCNVAVLTGEIDGGEAGSASVQHRLYLHSRTEGLLCAFFESIGHRKHGEPLRMNWGKVSGAKGLCKVGIRTYTNKDGEERQTNEIKKFLPPPAPKAAPVQQTWKTGNF